MNEEREGAIRPTLFLGLGGTGKEILLRLRRKFYERYGMSGLPCTAYLWIDTDTRDRMAQGEQMDDIFRAVAFQENERIGLLQGSVKDHLSGVFENKGQWEHIHRWLYPEVERFGSEISDGAGGVRAVGRLTFFFHYLKIRDRIRRVLEKIGTQETIDRTEKIIRGAEFITDPQVFIICSVAGGTGCGTFLDAAFLLKNLRIAERTVSVIFLPSVYHSTATGEISQRSHGNGYAALKELEFYTVRSKEGSVAKGDGAQAKEDSGMRFQVEWEKGEPLSIQGPPSSLTYLLERHNEGGIGLETRSELFYMVAESLFLDFMPGGFSSAKRSQYSNVAQYLSSQDAHKVEHEGIALPQRFARRYASFGMSKIEIPIDLLKGACGAHLAHKIASYWARAPLSANIRVQVLEDISQGERTLDADGLVRRFGTGWSDQIKSGIEGAFRGARFEQLQEVDELGGRLEDLERKTLRAEGDNPVRWGTVIAEIRSSRPGVAQQACDDLQQWLERCLEEQGRGLRALMKKDGYLVHLIENLKELYEFRGEGSKPELERRKEKASQDAELWGKERRRRRSELQTALRSFGLKILRLQPWTVDALREPWKDSEQQYALAKAEVCLLEEAKEVARSAVQYLEEKRRLLQEFDDSLDALIQKLSEREDGFLNFGEGVLFIRIFDREKDWPEYYALGVGPDGRRLPVDEVAQGRLFLEHEYKDAQANLWNLAESFPDQKIEGLSAKLIDFCEQRFITDFAANPRQVNVLEHPQLKGKLHETIQKLVRCALPMIRIDPKLGPRTVQVERHAYLGIAEKEVNPYRDFIDKVGDALQPKDFRVDPNNVLTTGTPHEVYLYLVSYAFALPALPAVKHDCHAAYYSFYKSLRSGGAGQERSHIPLHLANSWEGSFEDLMVYSDSEAKDISQSLEILLFGSILKVLDLNQIQGRLEYAYRKWVPPASRQEPLGNRQEAIESLRSDRRLRSALRSEIESREAGLEREQLEAFYWLLSSMSLEGLYARSSPEEYLLERKLRAVAGKLSDGSGSPASLSLDGLPFKERPLEARKRLGDDAQWVGSFPVLKSLDFWVYDKPA